MFRFRNLERLHTDMQERRAGRTVFPFEFRGRGTSCVFLADVRPMLLYITTLGANPFSVELKINRNYETESYVDRNFRELMRYFGIWGNPDADEDFTPTDLFKALDKQIPAFHGEQPTHGQVLRAAAGHRIIEESEKIYFCGWKRNPMGAKVSDKNYEKTRLAFGQREADWRRGNNLSSKWSAVEDEEVLVAINRLG
jgi:hypothetical protein